MSKSSNGINVRSILTLLLAGLLAVGCAESQRPSASGKGTIRGVHAMPSAPGLNFLIEEQSLGTLSYKGTTTAEAFDDLTYNFNFETRFPGDADVRRIATRSLAVVADTDYVLALTGTVDAPSVVVWETPERQWEGSETVFEASVGHLAASLGEVDVYLQPSTAATPVLGEAQGTLTFGDKLPPFDVENGAYVFTVTAPGDPGNVLFRSNPRSFSERTSVLFTMQEADASITSPISVHTVDSAGTSSDLADADSTPTRRYFHAASGTTNLDVVVDQDFAAPLVTNLAFGTISADVPVPAGESTYTFTQTGNPGGSLLEEENTIVANTRSTTFVLGTPGNLATLSFADNRRPVAGLAKLRMTLVSSNFDVVDLYLLQAGTAISEADSTHPDFDNLVSTGYLQLAAGSYELTVTTAGEKTVVAGPLALDLVSGSVVELAMIDTVDPNLLDIVVYDN